MKTLQHLAQYVLIALAMGATAQQGINYKAIVKDGGGNIVANQNISIQFQILKGAGLSLQYQETHNPITDANGIVIVNIGKGSIDSGVYADIDWSTDDHFLNVQIDTGSGLTDLGTTQFMAVPYALQASKASNVTGLEALDEGNGIGWRLIGRDPTSYGSLGLDAKDLSYSNATSTIFGATGDYSMALGAFTEASGDYSLATGNSTKSLAQMSTAMGANSIASGTISTALGWGTMASGNYAMSMGIATKAESYVSNVLGRYNIGGGTPNSWIESDPLFEIGNGASDVSRTNALTVLKNGTIMAPEFSVAEIETTGNPALITKEYADANFMPSGLKALDEGNSIGWRLIGNDPNNYGDIGERAIDLSFSDFPSIRGATGNRSIATGYATYASGAHSTAMGDASNASGDGATAFGSETFAIGLFSTAMGDTSIASGQVSTSMGNQTRAESSYSTAIGRYNIGGGDPASWIATDPLFEIGNGASDVSRTNALTVLKNGTITAPTFSIGEIETAGNPALITKEYADTNYTPSGLEILNEGNGFGWRLIGNDPLNYGNIGNGSVDLSYVTVPSTTYGATGNTSIAMGDNTTASGHSATAMGSYTEASGNVSTATGGGTLASGSYSTAMGVSTRAESFCAIAFGQYNIGGGTGLSWVESDPLFEIGIGTNNATRANALTVLKNGKVGIGTHTPNTKLQITGGGDANLGNTSGYMVIGDVSASNIVMDDNELMARNNGAAADLLLQWSGGDLYIGNSSATVYVNNVLTHSSDARLKQDITNLNYGLEEILKLRPVSYRWKSNPNIEEKTIGLIAQEVKPLINELVGVNKQRDNTLTLNYEGLIPVLINAIQEQQQIIESQKEELKSLKSDFHTRLKHLEESLNTSQQ